MTRDLVLLTTGEVAGRFQVSPETVRRWVRDGDLEAVVLPSGTLRFYPDVVDRFFERPNRPTSDSGAGPAAEPGTAVAS